MASKKRSVVTLYRRQRQIVEYIAQYIQRNGYSPTLREIGNAMGLSSLATVHEHITRLCKKGVLKKTDGNRTRGLIVVDKRYDYNNQGVNLPILGWISAGQPIDPYDQADSFLQVSGKTLSGLKRAFVLKVRDNSLNQDLIAKNDYIIVEENMNVDDGDIIIAILENGMATVKKFYKETTRIRLEAVTEGRPPIYAARIQIQGKVVGLVRSHIANRETILSENEEDLVPQQI